MSLRSVVLFPLAFASNIFVQPDTMPGWLHAVVNVNPVSSAWVDLDHASVSGLPGRSSCCGSWARTAGIATCARRAPT
jgi:ABC-type multidrug transport system permease subunit